MSFKTSMYMLLLLISDILFWGTILFGIWSFVKLFGDTEVNYFNLWLASLAWYFITDSIRAKVFETYLEIKEALK